jgi:hypothetical protein
MNHQNSNYNNIRCIVCGTNWDEHDKSFICERYRPFVSPPRAARSRGPPPRAEDPSHPRPTADEAEVARRELVGGVPTREWAGGRNGKVTG